MMIVLRKARGASRKIIRKLKRSINNHSQLVLTFFFATSHLGAAVEAVSRVQFQTR